MPNVPVNDINPIHQYVATANQTDFVFTYVIYATSDIKVYLNDVLKTEATDYTVKNSDGSAITAADIADGLAGGKVVFNAGLTLDDNVTLSRDVPAERTTGLTTAGAFRSDAMNLEFNKIIALIQQVQRDGERTIRQSPSDIGDSPIELPSLEERKGKFMFFNNTSGAPEAGPGVSVGDYALSEFGKGLIDDADASTALTTLGVSAFAKTLLDDADAATARATLAIPAQRLLPKQITIANGTDVNHDIDFTAGNFDFDDQSGQATLSAITKQIDAAWAEGTNAGGLDTGTVAADTFYYLFAIYNPTTQTSDALFSASKTSPTLPSGYTKKKYVGPVLTDGSANIVRFQQVGAFFYYKQGFVDVADGTFPTVPTNKTLTVPPNTIAIGTAHCRSTGTGYLLICPTFFVDKIASATNYSINISSSYNNDAVQLFISADSSSNISVDASSSLFGSIFTTGFIDPEL